MIQAVSQEARQEWPPNIAPDIAPADQSILQRVAAFTMTSTARQVALLEAVHYVVRRGIVGDFVECGVWRGGSSMIVALALAQLGVHDRDLWLFDTYEGMTPPTDLDTTLDGLPASELLASQSPDDASSVWCCASVDEVHANMLSTGYPADRKSVV
jgi:hypothetical protein